MDCERNSDKQPLQIFDLANAILRQMNAALKKNVDFLKNSETVISSHPLNASKEMKVIRNEFIKLAKSKGYDLMKFEKLVDRKQTGSAK